MKARSAAPLVWSIVLPLLAGCAKMADNSGSGQADNSAGSIAAGSVGGAINGSDANGTLAAWRSNGRAGFIELLISQSSASNSCATLLSTNNCAIDSAGAADLTLADCTYGASRAAWNGMLEVSQTTGGALSCGSYPADLSNNNLDRTYVSSAGVAGSATRTNAFGLSVTVDDATANLGNFDQQTIAPQVSGKYGSQVQFTNSARTGLIVQHHLYSTNVFDHSLEGSVSITDNGSSRIVNGSTTLYHNLLKVVAHSTFTNVTYDAGSCFPVSGTIATNYVAGVNVAPTTAGRAWVGKSETITFSSSAATMTDHLGNDSAIVLDHCY